VNIQQLVAAALDEDLGPLGDITAALLPPGAMAEAYVVPRADGVLAGRAAATEAFAQVDERIHVAWAASDGEDVDDGHRIAQVTGPLASVLTAERTALNFLCHLSGIATLTRRYVDLADGRTLILDTRKTTPGLRALEKAAVRAGGGVNHRGSLSDGILVKDNHLTGTSIAEIVAAAHGMWPGRSVEIECDTIDQVQEAVVAGATSVLLDNMSPADAAACVALVAGRLLVEVSGGVNLDNVGAYAAAGPDMISIGGLTHSAPILDIGLDLVG
jgi:nicotinate-nucleotide pyrophosphorylase (carboxylating)